MRRWALDRVARWSWYRDNYLWPAHHPVQQPGGLHVQHSVPDAHVNGNAGPHPLSFETQTH